MMERMMHIGYDPSVGRFNTAQIAQRSTWAVVPDEDTTFAAMHVIAVRPENASTCTYINALDPGSDGWRDHGHDDYGNLIPAGRM